MTDKMSALVSSSDDGRSYKLGKSEGIEVIFRADGDEIANKFAVTEWWMEPGAPGLESHVHETNHELMYVLGGTMSILIGEDWSDHEQGSFLFVPAGTFHGFKNNSAERAGLLNIFTDGAYEAMMPQLKAMFAAR